ncbi:MAG: hypothetical protein SNJ82_12015 [Gemmataceae bacterium]
MKESLRALLSGLIDYAGMFPPAKLPLGEAVVNHLTYRRGDEAWMLGRFVLPVARLQELASTEISVAALGRGGNAREFVEGLHADLGLIEEARQISEGRLVVDVLETKLPSEFVLSPEAIRPFLTPVCEMYERAGVKLFLELPATVAEPVFEALSGIGSGPDTPGVKLRTGGLEAAAFPSAEQVAVTLWSCSAEGLEFKATAGLHHPLPRYDAALKVRMHGFVNVFLAGVFIAAGRITPRETVELLEEMSPENFVLQQDALLWRGQAVSLAQIQQARRSFVRSFGSCSFDEPRDDLRALGWI